MPRTDPSYKGFPSDGVFTPLRNPITQLIIQRNNNSLMTDLI
jgi:hypothetical protein